MCDVVQLENAGCRVTVCMPAYNHERYIGRALEGLLAQTDTRFKVVACDDGSSDDTYEILQAYEPKFGGRLTVLTHPCRVNRGAYRTVDVCLDYVDTPFFVVHASDDFWEPDAVGYWLGQMATCPDTDVLYGRARVVDSENRFLERFHGEEETGDTGEIMERFFEACPAFEPTMFYRRDCIPILRMEGDLAYGDLYHNAILLQKKRVRFYPREVVNYRWHEGSSWQSIGREVFADRRLQVLERFYLHGIMKEYPRAQFLLLISLWAAASSKRDKLRMSQLWTEAQAVQRQLPHGWATEGLWEKAFRSAYIYNPHAHVELLAELPWRVGKTMIRRVPRHFVEGQYVSWRERASRRQRFHILRLLAGLGLNNFTLKNALAWLR